MIHVNIHWNWCEACQINESLKNFRHCRFIFESCASSSQGWRGWMLSWSRKTLQKPPEIRSIAHSKESLGKCEKRVSTISRRCRLASCHCKTRCHRTSHPTANRKRNQSRGFPASWGLGSKETASMAAQLPEAADFTRPRLELGPDYNTSWQGTKPAVLSSFTHSCSQVKSSEDKWINCRQTTTVQIALAGPWHSCDSGGNFMQPAFGT